MPEGEPFRGERLRSIWVCAIGSGDKEMGLAGGLVREVRTPREDSGLSGLGWSPWPGTQHSGAGDAAVTATSKSIGGHGCLAPPISTQPGTSLILEIIFHFPVFSLNWESTLEKNDLNKSVLRCT